MAQRDNQDNLKLARISTDIASVTKDDSFAMRTIAIMSIVFLPGIFVSVDPSSLIISTTNPNPMLSLSSR